MVALTAPASDAQRTAVARLAWDRPGARLHSRIGDNGPLWLTWPDGGALRVHPDGAAWPPGPAPTTCYWCREVARPLRPERLARYSPAFLTERLHRAQSCPVCGGTGVLTPEPAASECPPAHDSGAARSAETWLNNYPGGVAERVPIARRDGREGREAVRVAYAARRRARPDESASDAQQAIAEQMGLSRRQVRSRLARHAPHHESLHRTLAGEGLL